MARESIRQRALGGAAPRRSRRPDRPLWRTPAATVCAAILVAAAVGRLTRPDPPAPPGPVLLVGDSLFFQSGDELERALTGDGWDPTLVAYPGAGIAGGGYVHTDWSELLPDVVAFTRPRIAVVELGTNRCGEGCQSRPEAIDEIMDSLSGVDTVLWLTVRTDAPWPRGAAAINHDLEDAASTIVNLDLLPYDQWFVDRPELFVADGVHLTDTGQRAMAHRVRDALRERSTLAD